MRTDHRAGTARSRALLVRGRIHRRTNCPDHFRTHRRVDQQRVHTRTPVDHQRGRIQRFMYSQHDRFATDRMYPAALDGRRDAAKVHGIRVQNHRVCAYLGCCPQATRLNTGSNKHHAPFVFLTKDLQWPLGVAHVEVTMRSVLRKKIRRPIHDADTHRNSRKPLSRESQSLSAIRLAGGNNRCISEAKHSHSLAIALPMIELHYQQHPAFRYAGGGKPEPQGRPRLVQTLKQLSNLAQQSTPGPSKSHHLRETTRTSNGQISTGSDDAASTAAVTES